MAILEVHDLTLRFGGLEVIDRLSFDVEEGGIVSLIGPNGAGQDLGLQLPDRVLQANSGDIRFQGRVDHEPQAPQDHRDAAWRGPSRTCACSSR